MVARSRLVLRGQEPVLKCPCASALDTSQTIITMNVTKTLRTYGMVPIFAIVSGVAATIISDNELSGAPPATTSEGWLQTEMQTAASAALAFQHDEGRLPATLEELRSAKHTYLPRDRKSVV